MLRRWRRGVRGRVVLLVFTVACVLYATLATVGFLLVAGGARRAVHDRVVEVVDRYEARLRAGEATVSIETPDGVRVVAFDARRPPPGPAPGTMRVERPVTLRSEAMLLVGEASEAGLAPGLRALHRGLWATVAVAAALTGLAAGVATGRALRPVRELTRTIDGIEPRDDRTRVPVPASGDELEHLGRTVNALLDRVSDARRAQRRFTSDAAHELRTPLMALAGEIELAAAGVGPIDGALWPRLDAQVRRLGERVDELVLLSGLDEEAPLRLTEVDLLALVRDEAGAAAIPAGVSVRVDGPPDGAPVPAVVDRRLLGRAVGNLLANAGRHAEAQVRVGVVRRGDRAHIDVDDDGPGIDPAERERVFDRFARLDEGRSADRGGAGLGLAIVASVVQAHGGTVRATTAALGGARVSIELPVGAGPGGDGPPAP
ncbi:MAG: sensor histidine kinase [Acidimicrobiia bacterium]